MGWFSSLFTHKLVIFKLKKIFRHNMYISFLMISLKSENKIIKKQSCYIIHKITLRYSSILLNSGSSCLSWNLFITLKFVALNIVENPVSVVDMPFSHFGCCGGKTNVLESLWFELRGAVILWCLGAILKRGAVALCSHLRTLLLSYSYESSCSLVTFFLPDQVIDQRLFYKICPNAILIG